MMPQVHMEFFVACPRGAHRYTPFRLLQVQRSGFSLAKIQAIVQGASGLALVPFMLFSAVALLPGCLVSGLAAIWRVRLVLWLWLLVFGRGYLYLEWVFGFGWPSGCLVSRLAVNDLVMRCFGSCDWATGVHARAARLGPPVVGAWRFLALVIIGELGSSLA